MKRPSVSNLSLEEKVGQILMPQTSMLLYDYSATPPRRLTDEEVKNCIKKYKPGSIWHNGIPSENGALTLGTGKKVADLFNSLSSIPLLIAQDSETGLRYMFEDATDAVAPLSVGAANDEELTYNLYRGVCQEHKAMGSNWRWSPILDICNRFAGGGIGRTCSDDVERITRLALVENRASEKENVISCVKHFPGCDPYEFRDNHFVTDKISISLEEWEKKQGKVFKNAIDAGVMSIMTTHVAFPAVDDAMLYGKPISSTLSKKVITGLLREKMGFEGLIITDDIGMGGIATACSRTECIIRAINAGHDIILSVKPHEFDVIIEAVKNGEIPMSRIDESCERILKAKEMIGLFDENDESVDKAVAKKLISDSSKKITEKALTLLYDRNSLLPVSREHVKEVAIVCIAHDTDTIKKLELMKTEFEKRGANAIIYDGIDYANCEEIFSKDLIVYTGYIFQHNPMGMPSFYGEKMRCFFKAFSKKNEKSLGISLGYPYIHFDAMQGANTFINAYSRDPRTLEALVKAIYGEIEFTGTSPIDIEPKLRLVYC